MISIRLGTKIDTLDSTTAYFDGQKTSSRVLAFPDGVSRHITLRNSSWALADRLSREKGWPADSWAVIAFESLQLHRRKFPDCGEDFEDELRWFYEKAIFAAPIMDPEGDFPPNWGT